MTGVQERAEGRDPGDRRPDGCPPDRPRRGGQGRGHQDGDRRANCKEVALAVGLVNEPAGPGTRSGRPYMSSPLLFSCQHHLQVPTAALNRPVRRLSAPRVRWVPLPHVSPSAVLEKGSDSILRAETLSSSPSPLRSQAARPSPLSLNLPRNPGRTADRRTNGGAFAEAASTFLPTLLTLIPAFAFIAFGASAASGGPVTAEDARVVGPEMAATYAGVGASIASAIDPRLDALYVVSGGAFFALLATRSPRLI